MSINDEVALLRQTAPFTELDERSLRRLAFASELLSYKAGETILEQGKPGNTAYILMDGIVEASVKSGAESIVMEMGRHAFFGEIAVMRNTERMATVTAKADSKVLRITRSVLFELIKEKPELGQRITEHMTKAGYGLV